MFKDSSAFCTLAFLFVCFFVFFTQNRKTDEEYLSPLLLLILQPDLQLPDHHLSFPFCNGAASFIMSGHQGVDVSQNHIDKWYVLYLNTVKPLSVFDNVRESEKSALQLWSHTV